MGSMFVVTIPMRETEVKLRKKEFNLSVHRITEPISSQEKDDLFRTLSTVTSGSLKHNDSKLLGEGSFDSLDRTFSEEEVDIYSGFADGKTARVIVARDEMTIVPIIDDTTSISSTLDDKKKSDISESLMKSMDNIFLQKHLEDILSRNEVYGACWGQSADQEFVQVTFAVSSEKTEEIMNQLLAVGIGHKYNSSLCVCSASVFHEFKKDDELSKVDHGSMESGIGLEKGASKNKKWIEFISSIKSRLTVAQVVQGVKANAIMTFDYIVLIIVAGIIAGLGLVDNSPVNVVASMLVSPLMGPIMATTFGAVIRDFSLIKTGLISELVGLLICLVVGLIFGISLGFHKGPWENVSWPTDQMRSRGDTNSLVIGILVAIPSGAGVALSILAGNSGSLVGVAISASLLPPAVNCGILWGLSIVIVIKEKFYFNRNSLKPCGTYLGENKNNTWNKYAYFTEDYKILYCKNAAKEFSIMGINSFGLTWLNIFLIFLVGVIILKIKEVAPHTSRKAFSRFWKEDLKIARESNQQGGGLMKGLVNDFDKTEDKEGLLKKLEDDKTMVAVNRRTTPTSFMEDLKTGSLIKTEPTTNETPAQATSSNWGWFNMFGGPKSQAKLNPPPQPAEPENTENSEHHHKNGKRPIPKL